MLTCEIIQVLIAYVSINVMCIDRDTEHTCLFCCSLKICRLDPLAAC